jgi:hypothetical protein
MPDELNLNDGSVMEAALEALSKESGDPDQPDAKEDATDETEATEDESEDEGTDEDTKEEEETEEEAEAEEGETESSKDEVKPDDQPQYTITVDGEKKKVSLNYLLEHAQKGTHYTQEMQKLSEERKQFEQANKVLIALADRIEEDKDLQKLLKDHFAKKQYGQPYTPQLEEQIKARQTENKMQAMDTLAKFADAHPELTDEHMQEIVAQAAVEVQRTGAIPDLEKIYKASQFDQVTTQIKQLEKQIAELRKQEQAKRARPKEGSSPPVMGSGGSAPKPRKQKVTLDGKEGIDAKTAAAAYLRQLQTE